MENLLEQIESITNTVTNLETEFESECLPTRLRQMLTTITKIREQLRDVFVSFDLIATESDFISKLDTFQVLSNRTATITAKIAEKVMNLPRTKENGF